MATRTLLRDENYLCTELATTISTNYASTPGYLYEETVTFITLQQSPSAQPHNDTQNASLMPFLRFLMTKYVTREAALRKKCSITGHILNESVCNGPSI